MATDKYEHLIGFILIVLILLKIIIILFYFFINLSYKILTINFINSIQIQFGYYRIDKIVSIKSSVFKT